MGKTNNKEIESHRDVKAPDRNLITADNCSNFNVLTSKHMKHHITSDVEFSSEALGKTNHKEIESHRDVKAPGSLTAPDNCSTLDMDRDFNILTSKHMKHHITSDVDFSSEALD